MNSEVGNAKTESDVDDDVEFAASPDDTVVITEDVDDLDAAIDTTAELNVDELVKKLDKDASADHKKEVRRRLEELEEQRREAEELESTYNFNLDEEV